MWTVDLRREIIELFAEAQRRVLNDAVRVRSVRTPLLSSSHEPVLILTALEREMLEALTNDPRAARAGNSIGIDSRTARKTLTRFVRRGLVRMDESSRPQKADVTYFGFNALGKKRR